MNTSLIQGPVAQAWHGADIAYFVNLLVAAVLYGGYRLLRRRGRVGRLTRGVDEVVDQVDHFAGPFDVREVADACEHLEPASLAAPRARRSHARRG